MDKLAVYNALQELAQAMAQGGRDGFAEGQQEQILAQAQQIAQAGGLDANAIENWLGQAAGGRTSTDVPGLGTPEAIAQANLARSDAPGALGLTLDQLAKDTGSTISNGFVSEATTPKDYMLGDNSTLLQNVIKFGGLAAAGYGLGTGLESLLGNAAAGAGGTSLLDPSLITSPVAPVSTGSAFGTVDPFLQGVTQTMPATLGASVPAGSTLGTAAPFTSGLGAVGSPAAAAALSAWEAGAPAAAATGAATVPTPPATPPATPTAGDPFIDAYTPPNPNVPQGTWGAPVAGTGAAASLLNSIFKTNLTDADTGLIGKLLATGLGGIGASQQASASSDLAKQFMDLGKPYRDSLASLEANPASYYQSPEVKGALQQGSDALARSLSAKVGNPILNPTALQEMQNYSTNGLLGQLNQRRNFLANAGGLGVGQAAQLGTNAAQASGGVYNALGAGLGTVFGNQRDYAGDLLDILKNRGSSSGMSLS